MNRAIRTVFVCAALLSLGVAGALGVNAKRPPKVRSLVWRSSSSREENKLTIDLERHRAELYVFGLGVVTRDGGPPTDRTRKIVRDLPLPEIEDLSRLANAADLFQGETAGIELDFSCVAIEAHGRRGGSGDVNIFVVTANPSFDKPGARRELADRLVAIERRLLSE